MRETLINITCIIYEKFDDIHMFPFSCIEERTPAIVIQLIDQIFRFTASEISVINQLVGVQRRQYEHKILMTKEAEVCIHSHVILEHADWVYQLNHNTIKDHFILI